MRKCIEIHNLRKHFGEVEVIKDISFYVEEGSLFSLLGTNGAGKSTTISILLTLLKQDAGQVQVNGHVVGQHNLAIRKEIGIVFQQSLLDPILTVRQNLSIRAAFYYKLKDEQQDAIQRVIDIARLSPLLNRTYGHLSGGERRRVDIARALLHQPSILILDEPTTGLDVESRKLIWQTILQLQKETNMTVFLTTHYIEEAVDSDYVVLLDEGKIVAKGTPAQLTQQYSNAILRIIPIDLKQLVAEAQFDYEIEKNELIIPIEKTTDAIPILKTVENQIKSFEVRNASLEDVFYQITKKEVSTK